MQPSPFRLKYVKLPPMIRGDLQALKCLRLQTSPITWLIPHLKLFDLTNSFSGGVLGNNADDLETIKRPRQELATRLQGFGAARVSYKDWQ